MRAVDMSNHLLARLLELLWGATLVMTFAFGALLLLTVTVSLVATAHLIGIPDRICNPDTPRSGVTQICT
jgi:hypothetical protein